MSLQGEGGEWVTQGEAKRGKGKGETSGEKGERGRQAGQRKRQQSDFPGTPAAQSKSKEDISSDLHAGTPTA
jgi:hypothetical protein